MSCGPADHVNIRRVCFVPQDQPRPPVYNVEDYAGALRKFGKRGQAPADGDPSAEPKHTEMTLKEFTSATELLDKLKADLKLAYFRYATRVRFTFGR